MQGVEVWDGDTVVVACEGAQPDYGAAIEAVAYELARHNGESPLDRGAALRRRVERLARELAGTPPRDLRAAARRAPRAAPHGDPVVLARAFELLVAERGWRGEESGLESASRVVSMTRITVPA